MKVSNKVDKSGWSRYRNLEDSWHEIPLISTIEFLDSDSVRSSNLQFIPTTEHNIVYLQWENTNCSLEAFDTKTVLVPVSPSDQKANVSLYSRLNRDLHRTGNSSEVSLFINGKRIELPARGGSVVNSPVASVLIGASLMLKGYPKVEEFATRLPLHESVISASLSPFSFTQLAEPTIPSTLSIQKPTIERANEFAINFQNTCQNFIEQGYLDDAISYIMKEVDSALRDEKYDVINNLMLSLDVNKLTTECHLAFVTLAFHWRDELPNWKNYVQRFENRLINIGKSKRDVKAILSGLV